MFSLIVPLLASKSARIVLSALAVLAFIAAFAADQQNRGAVSAVAKIEKATDDAIKKAQSAGSKSRQSDGGGMQLPYLRD
jgi:hypothetical protein